MIGVTAPQSCHAGHHERTLDWPNHDFLSCGGLAAVNSCVNELRRDLAQ